VNERRLYSTRVLHGQVAHQIGREIVSGKVREGDFLPRESEFAERFGVSRQAIREALKVLTAKGLVGSRRRTGTFVLPRSSWNLFDPDVLAWHPLERLSPSFLAAIVELRGVIEPAAAEMAAARGTPSSVAAISAALDDMRRHLSGDRDAFARADSSFHLAIFAASGNDLIDRMSVMMRPLLDASLLLQDRVRVTADTDTIAMHEAVLRAIVERSPAKARRAMEDVLTTASHEIGAVAAAQISKNV
jgi:GntR family transcriptional regulator, galactonate operon transcriptional repressor